MSGLSNEHLQRQLVELQLDLECNRVERGEILVPFPCANPDLPPRVLVAEIGTHYHVYLRRDVPASVQSLLRALSPEVCFTKPEVVRTILAKSAPCATVWRNRASVIPKREIPPADSEVVRLPTPNEQGFPIFAILADGVMISGCSSSRENTRCGEAWIWTDERFRGRGYASRVVTAWAEDLHQQGKIPFYSHLIENTASEHVARKLGLVPFASEIGYV